MSLHEDWTEEVSRSSLGSAPSTDSPSPDTARPIKRQRTSNSPHTNQPSHVNWAQSLPKAESELVSRTSSGAGLVGGADDRLIPPRARQLTLSSFRLSRSSRSPPFATRTRPRDHSDPEALYQVILTNELTGSPSPEPDPASSRVANVGSSGFLSFESQVLLKQRKAPVWSIPTVPVKVLDAPSMTDNLICSVLDWSSTGTLVVGLADNVYVLPNAGRQSPGQVARIQEPHAVPEPGAVRWSPNAHLLACANRSGIRTFDGPTLSHLRTITHHDAPVASLCFVTNSVLYSASSVAPGTIHQTDLRAPLTSVRTLSAHRGAVASLSCAALGGAQAGPSQGVQQLASGGRDEMIAVWDVRGGSGLGGRKPLFKIERQGGPVLATGWSGQQRGILASCGGDYAKELRIWDTKLAPAQAGPTASAKADSTICNIGWSETSHELVTTHSEPKPTISLWKFSSLTAHTTLVGHTRSVTQMAGPIGSTIVTAAGDETVRFWECFPPPARGPRSVGGGGARGGRGPPGGALDVLTVR